MMQTTPEHPMTTTMTAAAPVSDASTPAGYVQRTATRAGARSYLAVVTPQEFFAGPHLNKMSRDLGRRFAKCASFLRAEDVTQDAVVQILEAARRWTPGRGVPFGGYAFRSAELWLVGAMHRASVPVSGPLDSRAIVESIRHTSLESPRGTGEDATTLGALLGWEDTDTGETHRPDDAASATALKRAVMAEAALYPADLADAMLAVLHGATIPDDELPEGYTDAGLRREAEKFRTALQARLRGEDVAPCAPPAPTASEPLPAPQDADADPWGSVWG
jgi:DNA-directed RNA polymerase specialized sigma24 family protein